jgi:hypothetical protein
MFLSMPVATGFLIQGFVTRELVCFIIAGGVVAAGLTCLTLNFMMSGRLRCPLCMVTPLQNRRCSKHRSAPKLFGSHRLSVALSILFKQSFRCPYCGEATAMQVRPRGGRPR